MTGHPLLERSSRERKAANRSKKLSKLSASRICVAGTTVGALHHGRAERRSGDGETHLGGGHVSDACMRPGGLSELEPSTFGPN